MSTSVQLVKTASDGKQLAVKFNAVEDLSKIKIQGEPRAAYGSIFTNVVYDGRPLTLVLPPMVVAWDPSSYKDSKKVTVDLDFREAQTHSAIKDCYDAMRGIDRRMGALVVMNRDKLLPTVKRTGPLAKSDEEVLNCYQCCTRPRTSAKSDRAWPARLGCTLTGAKILGGDGDVKSVVKGDVVRCVISATALCTRQERVTLGWRIVQLRKIEEGLPYPDMNLTEEEAYGLVLSGEGNGEGPSAMQIDQEFV